jgi:hypothetical protein
MSKTISFPENELRALVTRAMQGAAAAERERWAQICDLLIATAPMTSVSPRSVLKVLAERLRRNDGPRMADDAIERVLDACYEAAGMPR